jgi:hypothetical protein
MNTVGEKIDIAEVVKTCREFDLSEIHGYIVRSGAIRMSWGFRNAGIIVTDKAYRFTVSGHHHKGHVYIVLNGADLFDIYYTSNRGNIKKISKDIYIDDLINVLDKDIEYVKAYN